MSLQDCAALTRESLSNPESIVIMPLPTLIVGQRHRVDLGSNLTLDVVGREWFDDLYKHVISDRQNSRVNVMGTKGFGKSYRLAALVGLLLKQVRLAA